jgi:hypothetical protein
MAILREPVTWKKPRPTDETRRSSDLTPDEHARVRAALRFLRVRQSGTVKLAKALRVNVASIQRGCGRDGKPLKVQRQIEWVEDSTVIGVWVASAHGRDKGVAEIDAPLSFEELSKGADYARALGIWQEFSQWVQKLRDVKLPAPQLFVAPTEVA